MAQFITINTFCHKQIFISLGIFFIEWAPTYTINVYVKICPFDNLMCLWLRRNNVNSTSSKLLRRCNFIFPTSKLFPISANPFKLSKAKAIANTPQSILLGCCCTLGGIISKTLSPQWARSQVWIGARVNGSSIPSYLWYKIRNYKINKRHCHYMTFLNRALKDSNA